MNTIQKYSRIIIGGVTLLLLIGLIISKTTFASTTKENNRKDLIVSSVYIEPGDSLWSIAEKYYSDDYDSVRHYVNVIKRSNGLSDDRIYTGTHLIVPHYYFRCL